MKKFVIYPLFLGFFIFNFIFSLSSLKGDSDCFIDGTIFGMSLSSISFVFVDSLLSFFKWFKQRKAV